MNIKKVAQEWSLPVFFLITSVCIFVPFMPRMPAGGIDPSWEFGLNQALAQGLAFGRDIIFTFGPYASIYTKNYHPLTDNLMIWSSVYFGLSFGLALLLNFRKTKWYIQILLLIVLTGTTYASIYAGIYVYEALLLYYPLLVSTYIFSSTALAYEIGKKVSYWYLLLIILFIPFGLLPLVKGTTIFICIIIIMLVFLWFVIKKAWICAILVCLIPLISLIIFWVIAGQSLCNLPTYFLSIFPIIFSYTDAMSRYGGTPLEPVCYIIASVALLWAILLNKTTESTTKIFLLLTFFSVLLMSFKIGFVRSSVSDHHQLIASVMILLAAFLLKSIDDSCRSFFTLFIALFVWLFIGHNFKSHYTANMSILDNMKSTYQNAWSGLKLRMINKERLKYIFLGNIVMLNSYAKFPKLQGTVDVYSYDQAYLIASGNIWSPRPVFQSYAAYTPTLIEKNRAHLLGSNSPDNIIFKIQTIDGRMPSMDDGASWPVILAYYDPATIQNEFLFLKKREIVQQISESIISKNEYAFGEMVKLPRSNSAIYVKINIAQSIWGKIATIFFKLNQLEIVLNMENGESRSYRIISGMVKTGLLISPLIENSTEFALLYAGVKYLVGKKVKSFMINTKGGEMLWNAKYEVEFISLKLPRHDRLLGITGVRK